jgi:hypothetical protein
LSQGNSIFPDALNPPNERTLSLRDIRNTFGTGATANYSFSGGTAYQLKVSGDARTLITGGEGTVSLTTSNTKVTPIPEADTHTMLLAGLGMLCTLVRRRRKKWES